MNISKSMQGTIQLWKLAYWSIFNLTSKKSLIQFFSLTPMVGLVMVLFLLFSDKTSNRDWMMVPFFMGMGFFISCVLLLAQWFVYVVICIIRLNNSTYLQLQATRSRSWQLAVFLPMVLCSLFALLVQSYFVHKLRIEAWACVLYGMVVITVFIRSGWLAVTLFYAPFIVTQLYSISLLKLKLIQSFTEVGVITLAYAILVLCLYTVLDQSKKSLFIKEYSKQSFQNKVRFLIWNLKTSNFFHKTYFAWRAYCIKQYVQGASFSTSKNLQIFGLPSGAHLLTFISDWIWAVLTLLIFSMCYVSFLANKSFLAFIESGLFSLPIVPVMVFTYVTRVRNVLEKYSTELAILQLVPFPQTTRTLQQSLQNYFLLQFFILWSLSGIIFIGAAYFVQISEVKFLLLVQMQISTLFLCIPLLNDPASRKDFVNLHKTKIAFMLALMLIFTPFFFSQKEELFQIVMLDVCAILAVVLALKMELSKSGYSRIRRLS
jgi:hypothetical protein